MYGGAIKLKNAVSIARRHAWHETVHLDTNVRFSAWAGPFPEKKSGHANPSIGGVRIPTRDVVVSTSGYRNPSKPRPTPLVHLNAQLDTQLREHHCQVEEILFGAVTFSTVNVGIRSVARRADGGVPACDYAFPVRQEEYPTLQKSTHSTSAANGPISLLLHRSGALPIFFCLISNLAIDPLIRQF